MKKIILACLMLIIISILSGCGQVEPSEQAKLTLVDNGVEVYACGDRSVKVGANLLIDAKATVHEGQFESYQSCTLQPGESTVLTYDNPYCTVIDLLDYDITVLPIKVDLDIIFWIALGIGVIVSFVIVIAYDDPTAGKAIAVISLAFALLAVFIARLVLYLALPGPVDFYFFGGEFLM